MGAMAANVVLLALRPSEKQPSEAILDGLRRSLNRESPLQVGPDSRVAIHFLSCDQPEGLRQVQRGLDSAGQELDIDWCDYFVLSPPSGPDSVAR